MLVLVESYSFFHPSKESGDAPRKRTLLEMVEENRKKQEGKMIRAWWKQGQLGRVNASSGSDNATILIFETDSV